MSEIMSASSQRLDFMQLLVTQLQNQNPLEPMNNQDMAAQLAQFSELEQSEQMNANLSSLNSTFSKVLQNSQFDYAQSILGKGVSFEKDGYMLQGQVAQVRLDKDGVMLDVDVSYEVDEQLEIARFEVALDDIQSIIGQ